MEMSKEGALFCGLHNLWCDSDTAWCFLTGQRVNSLTEFLDGWWRVEFFYDGQWGGVLYGCVGDDILFRVQLPVVLNPSLHLLVTALNDIARGGV
jgi:hypothetical protein